MSDCPDTTNSGKIKFPIREVEYMLTVNDQIRQVWNRISDTYVKSSVFTKKCNEQQQSLDVNKEWTIKI